MLSKKKVLSVSLLFICLLFPTRIFGMHIMEGFLSPLWCTVWGILAIPFIGMGFVSIRKTISEHPQAKLLLAMAGAFAFALSALKIPSVTGSCSHPTGVGLGAILFGPTAMSVLGFIVLLFQALLLAHGGITTLGANTFSMAIVGPIVSFVTYRLVKKTKASQSVAVFLAAFFGNLLTYVTTSIQLALAYPDPVGGFIPSLEKFMGIFALTQIPLAISEGLITVLIFNALATYTRKELKDLNVLSKEVV